MPDFGNSAGLKRGTREWLFAISVYYSGDNDILELCRMVESAQERIVELEEIVKRLKSDRSSVSS